jgi:hypothetical protein
VSQSGWSDGIESKRRKANERGEEMIKRIIRIIFLSCVFIPILPITLFIDWILSDESYTFTDSMKDYFRFIFMEG